MKQIKRMKNNLKPVLVGLDDIMIINQDNDGNPLKSKEGKKFARFIIKASSLFQQIDFGELKDEDGNIIPLAEVDANGNNIYYSLSFCGDNKPNGVTMQQGYYSLEGANIWIDTRKDMVDKHTLRVREYEALNLFAKFDAKKK